MGSGEEDAISKSSKTRENRNKTKKPNIEAVYSSGSGESSGDGDVGYKTPVQSSTEKSSGGGDIRTFEKEAMAWGLLRPMKMYMTSIGQEEPIRVGSIKEALRSRKFIPDIGRFVYKVKPGQIFEYDGNNYVKIQNSDNLKDKDTKYQIVDGKMQTEIEDLIPVEKRRKLLADVQANVDDADGLQTEFAPRLRF